MQQWKPRHITVDDFKKPNFVCTPDECVQKIRQYTNLGVTNFMLFFGDLPQMDGLRIFAEKVINKL